MIWVLVEDDWEEWIIANCFDDHLMMMFTQFIAENEFPCVTKIDVSGKESWDEWCIENDLTEASVIPFIQTLLEKGIPNLQMVNLSCITIYDLMNYR